MFAFRNVTTHGDPLVSLPCIRHGEITQCHLWATSVRYMPSVCNNHTARAQADKVAGSVVREMEWQEGMRKSAGESANPKKPSSVQLMTFKDVTINSQQGVALIDSLRFEGRAADEYTCHL